MAIQFQAWQLLCHNKARFPRENAGNNKSLRLRPPPALCEEIPR
ncbi:hypothetical protein QE391_004942 [Pseudomonas fluorescens]|nr:hypothetical protein [Pseudomonas fluorescens]